MARLSVCLYLSLTVLVAVSGVSADCLADEPRQIQDLLDRGEIDAAETAASSLLRSTRAEFGADSRESAAALELLVESLWRGPAVSDSTTLELARRLVALKEHLYGPESSETGRSLYHPGVIHGRNGDPVAARPWFERGVEILENAPGEHVAWLARAYHGYANNLRQMGEMEEALAVYENSRRLYEDSEGPEGLHLASVLVELGGCLTDMGRIDDAEAILHRALEIRGAVLGPDAAKTCEIRTSLAACAYRRGDLDSAGVQQRDAIACLQLSRPDDDPAILHGLQNLAWLETELGNFSAADTAFVRLLDLSEASAGPQHPKTLGLRRIYAAHLYYTGAYTAALAEAQAASDGLRASLGDQSTVTDDAISTLAEIHRSLGNYEEARQLYLESAGHREREGENQGSLALRYNGLGLVALDLGDAADARRWFTKSLALSIEYEGESHYHTAAAYANLADAEAAAGDTDTALKLYAKSLEIYDDSVGPGYPDAVQARVVLGQVLAQHGDLDGAADVLGKSQRALLAMEQPQPQWLGMNLHELARIRLRQDRLAEADSIETVAIDYLGRAHGENSPQVAWSLITRGWARSGMGRDAEAFADAARAEGIGESYMDDLIPWLPERTALAWAQRRPHGLSLMFETARRTGDREQLGSAWSGLVRTRAVVLDELGRRARLARGVDNPELARAMDELRRSRERLANAVLDDWSDPSTLDRASVAKDRAERKLTRALADEIRPAPIDVRSLADQLSPGTALLSYLRIRDARGQASRYLALILRPGDVLPRMVDLGDASSLDSAMEEWGESMREGARAVGPFAAAAIGTNRRIGEEIRRRVWDPLGEALAGLDHLLVVPDGALHGLSFAALPVEADRWLLEDGPLFTLLSTERDLFFAPASVTAPGNGLLCVGDPDFDLVPGPALAMVDGPAFRGASADCDDFADFEFARLPYSAREVEKLIEFWPGDSPTLLMGEQASEASFKREAGTHQVLHLATHAFYLGSGCAQPREGPDHRSRDRALGENPLLLSGLALAGANQRDAGGSDGILTAEEVAALDLGAVELAVLSACETGAGLPVTGEGVLGLRRAFRLAGVGALVTSLWPVNDEAAADWMEKFYEARWSGNEGLAAAVATASSRCLSQRRESGRSTHPAHWAAFVGSGFRGPSGSR